MTTTPAGQPNLEALRLDLPMIAATRVHQTRTLPQPFSATHREHLWLADLDFPVRASRWARGFRQVDLGVFEKTELASHKRRALDACGLDEGRVLMLANPAPEATTPQAFWVLDDTDRCIAQAIDVLPHAEGRGLLVVGADFSTLEGTISTPARSEHVTGRLNSYLGQDGVRLGAQLMSSAGQPLLTVSMSGRLLAASSRELLQSATALAA